MWLTALTFVLCITAVTSLRCGSGPEPPNISLPEHRRTALVDCGPDLDTNCETRTLTAQLEITQFVGPTDADGYLTPETLLELPSSLSLTIPAFDIDFNPTGNTNGRPERDTVTFNGFALGFLYGENELWFENTFSIPMNKIKFARWSNGTIIPGVNNVIIDINVENAPGTGTNWCASIDWVALYGIPEYVRPIVLVPGLGKHQWDEGWIPELDKTHVPYIHVSFGVGELTIQQRSTVISSTITDWLTLLGAGTADIVAFGKGGIDVRAYLEDNSEYVTNVVTLASPHCGNRFGDIIERSGINDDAQNTWEYAKELSSSRMEAFNEVYGEPSGLMYTVGATKDDLAPASSATCLSYGEKVVIDEQHQGGLGKHTADIFLSILLPKSVTGRDKYVITPPPQLPEDVHVFFDDHLGGVAGGQEEQIRVTLDSIGTTDYSIVVFSTETHLTFNLRGPGDRSVQFPLGTLISGQFIYTSVSLESAPGEWIIIAQNGNTGSPEVIPFAVTISGEDAVPLEIEVTPPFGPLGTVYTITATTPVSSSLENLQVSFSGITTNNETSVTMTSTSETVFTGQFTPTDCYQNSVRATLTGSVPRIADTTISMGCQVLPEFTIEDSGVDNDGDTFFDNLRIRITYPQIDDKNLIFKTSLTSQGSVISKQKGEIITSAPTGPQTIECSFPAEDIIVSELPSPYGLEVDIFEIDSYGRPILLQRVISEEAIQTPYNVYEFDSGDMVQSISDSKESTGDTLSNFLNVNITFFLAAKGQYVWTCALVDEGHTTITQVKDVKYFERGVNWVMAKFNGNDIRESGRTGRYLVEGFILKSGGTLLRQQKSFKTRDYSWTEFGNVTTDLNGQIKGEINDVELSGNQLIIGGLFTRVAGVDVRGTAIFDLSTGTWKYIDPSSAALTGTVQTVAANSKGVFVGGALASEDVVYADYGDNSEFKPLGKVDAVIEELVANDDYLCAFSSTPIAVDGISIRGRGVCYNFAEQRWDTEGSFGSYFPSTTNAEITPENILYFYYEGLPLTSINLTSGEDKNLQILTNTTISISGERMFYATLEEFGILDTLTGEVQETIPFTDVGGGAQITSVSAVAHDEEFDRLFFSGQIGYGGSTWHDNPQPVMVLDLQTKNVSTVPEVSFVSENTSPPVYLGYSEEHLTGFGKNFWRTSDLTSKSFFVATGQRPTTLPPTTTPPTTPPPTTKPPTTVAPTEAPTTQAPPTTLAPWVKYVEEPPTGPSVDPIVWAVLGVIIVGLVVAGFALSEKIRECCCGAGGMCGGRRR